MNFLQKIIAVWQKVNIVQRAMLMAIVLTMGIIGALLTYWAKLPDMRVLFAELNPEEAAKITDKISEKNIAYELRNGGRSVYVPKDMVYQLRLDLAKDGLPAGEQGGYRLFDDEKIGVSPFVQNVNLKRALQDELAKSIQMIEGVQHARIHIVSSEQAVFSSGQQQTSASVVLKLKPGYKLGGGNIAAIANLVAGSVEGLKTENVTIVDSDGRLLSGQADQAVAGGAGTVADYRQRVEQNLAEKVEQMLQTVLGPGRATVRVSAEVNMTSVTMITETYSPTGKVATKEEIKSNSETEPAASVETGKTPLAGGIKKEETTQTEYVVGKTVEQKSSVPGDVMSISVAAVVDLSPAEANQAQGTDQSAKIMQLTDVEKLIETALGLDLKGKDSLKVVEAKFFHPPATPDDAQQPKKLDYATIASHASLGITAICALFVLRIFTKAKKKAAAETVAQIPAGAENMTMLPGMTSAAEPVVVRRQLAEVMRNNPDQARRLFVNWLQEKSA
jgi:flagellar M-ring protein FliF